MCEADYKEAALDAAYALRLLFGGGHGLKMVPGKAPVPRTREEALRLIVSALEVGAPFLGEVCRRCDTCGDLGREVGKRATKQDLDSARASLAEEGWDSDGLTWDKCPICRYKEAA